MVPKDNGKMATMLQATNLLVTMAIVLLLLVQNINPDSGETADKNQHNKQTEKNEKLSAQYEKTLKLTEKVEKLSAQYVKTLVNAELDSRTFEKFKSELNDYIDQAGEGTQSKLDSALRSAIWLNSLAYILSDKTEKNLEKRLAAIEDLQEFIPDEIPADLVELLNQQAASNHHQKTLSFLEQIKSVSRTDEFEKMVLTLGDQISPDIQTQVDEAIATNRMRILGLELNGNNGKIADLRAQLNKAEKESDNRIKQALIQQINFQCQMLATQVAQIEKPLPEIEIARDSLLKFWDDVQDRAWDAQREPFLSYQRWAAQQLQEVRLNDLKTLTASYKNLEDPKGLAKGVIGERLVSVFGIIDVTQLDPALAQQYQNLYLRDLQEIDEDVRFDVAKRVAVQQKRRVGK